MIRHIPGDVVIDVEHRRPCGEQPVEVGPVFFHRHVQHRDPIAMSGGNTTQQVDIAFHSRDQFTLTRHGKMQLHQRADTIGVTIEYIPCRFLLSFIGISDPWAIVLYSRIPGTGEDERPAASSRHLMLALTGLQTRSGKHSLHPA